MLIRKFSTTSSQSRQLLITRASDNYNSDELIPQLVSNLESNSIDVHKQAAMEIRLLAKNKPENPSRVRCHDCAKSLCDENKELIVESGAIKPLVRALKIGNSTAKENSACALLRLSQIEENKIAIERSGAIPPLVNLLEADNFREKKDASTTLFCLCMVKENKIRVVQAGVMKLLVELIADFSSNMVDKSAFVVSVLISMVVNTYLAL
ncbi:hypothetical protein RDI58_009829 [Solanum bulbocastanum]|uniref:Uncharacterized protein n=1 Tax=Solanum bulbocastanum TaxID=147425 RepID=A0AAN8TU05_SOLBU